MNMNEWKMKVPRVLLFYIGLTNEFADCRPLWLDIKLLELIWENQRELRFTMTNP